MAIAWIDYALKDGPMDPNERYVFLALCNRADADGKCFPSVSTIVRETRLSESTVRRAIIALEAEGFLEVERGVGAGHTSKYTVKKVSEGKVSQRKVSVGLKKGVTQTEKRCHTDNSPTPPIRSNRHLTVREPSAGANGEFMAATHLWQELGIAAAGYDVQMLAQVIGFVARDGNMETQAAAEGLLLAAQKAIARGDRVNTFWFKDRKFTGEPSNGANHSGGRGKSSSPAKERVHAGRKSLAESTLKRGWFTVDDLAGKNGPPVSEPRPERNVTGVPE